MKESFSVIRQCPLFNDISDSDLLAMLTCLGGKKVSYKKGQLIMSEGDSATLIGIVLSGEVQMISVDFYGNRSLVTQMNPTDIFGESFACADIEHMPVDIVASEDSEVLLIEARRITKTCSNACEFHARIIFNLLKLVATKNIVFHQKIEITSKRTTREKLMTYLMSEAKKCGKSTFTVPYDRQELADYLEVDRSGLSALIGKLKKEGVIDNDKSTFTLL